MASRWTGDGLALTRPRSTSARMASLMEGKKSN